MGNHGRDEDFIQTIREWRGISPFCKNSPIQIHDFRLHEYWGSEEYLCKYCNRQPQELVVVCCCPPGSLFIWDKER